MKRGMLVVSALVVIMLGSGVLPASATFPGATGKIAFESFGDGTHIGVVEPDGSGLTFLTPSDRRADYEPFWSADGTTIVFDTQRPDQEPKILTMAADGTGRTVVFSGARRVHYIIRPVWSPDGSRIAFCAFVGNAFDGQIFAMNADGSSLTNLSGSDNGSDCYPDWSPDGTKIAFSDGTAVMTMNTDGTGRTVVVEHGSWPSWSPDGTMIAFARFGRRKGDIYVTASNGSSVTQLTDTPRRREETPAFSPDGTLVAFARASGPDDFDAHDIWTIAVGDLTPTRITDTRRDEYALGWQPLSP